MARTIRCHINFLDVMSVLCGQAPSVALETRNGKNSLYLSDHQLLVADTLSQLSCPVPVIPLEECMRRCGDGSIEWLQILLTGSLKTWLGVTEQSPVRFGKMHLFLERIRIFPSHNTVTHPDGRQVILSQKVKTISWKREMSNEGQGDEIGQWKSPWIHFGL